MAVTESRAVKTLGWPGPVRQSCPSSCRRAPAILKIPKYPANPASDHPPNIVAKKITDHPHNPLNHSSDNRSYKPTCASSSPGILKIPNYPANPASDNPPIIAFMKITAHPHNPLNHSSDNRSYKPTCASSSPGILKIPNYPANPASDNPPIIAFMKITAHPHNPLNHSSDNRSYKHTCAGRTRPLFSKLTNMPFSFRMTQATKQPSPQFRLK